MKKLCDYSEKTKYNLAKLFFPMVQAPNAKFICLGFLNTLEAVF